jgi:hypothetical protein
VTCMNNGDVVTDYFIHDVVRVFILYILIQNVVSNNNYCIFSR